MIKEELEDFTKKSVELLTKCAVDAFNNNYNLDLDINQIINNISKDKVTEENNKEVTEKENVEDAEEEITLLMENLCFATKKDGSKCNKKLKGYHLLCGTHNSIIGTIPLPEYIDIIYKEKNYEIKPKVISIGNNWVEDTKMDKWPQIITTSINALKGYIMFFTEFDDYLGAGVFIVQYNSSLKKKKPYCLATHYVEVNNYCEAIGGSLYVKVSFTQLKKLEDKPIYNRIKDILKPYDIGYDLNEVTRGKKDISDSNPIVISSKVNDILYKHNDVMYFNKDDYLKFCIENDNANRDFE